MTGKLNPSWAIWQVVAFWSLWLLLLFPAYFAAHGVWLIGMPMFSGFHETVDVVLLGIMVASLLLLTFMAARLALHFHRHTKSFWRLLTGVLVGLLGVPLLSASSAVYAYISLTVPV